MTTFAELVAATNFSFLRNLHNSLARRSERADLDIALMDAAKAKRGTKGKGSEQEETFHFIAYVPVNGVLWELDGLRRQPVRLGISCLERGNCREYRGGSVGFVGDAEDTGTD